jgi:hypothetical protein
VVGVGGWESGFVNDQYLNDPFMCTASKLREHSKLLVTEILGRADRFTESAADHPFEIKRTILANSIKLLLIQIFNVIQSF